MTTIISYKGPTRPDLRQAEARRPARGTVGSWLADLAALGKAIVLCDSCGKKWNPRAAGYEKRSAVPGYNYVVGDCDGCARWGQSTLYIPEVRRTYGGDRARGTYDEICGRPARAGLGR